MSDFIVETIENVTLIGAGEVNKGNFADALAIAPYLVAADGGAELALNYGKTPNKVIGDLDSLDHQLVNQIQTEDVLIINEQDSTDFEKCLRTLRAPLILGVGFLGRRLDHQLAALNALVVYHWQTCVLIGIHDVVFHLSRPVELDLPPGSRLSLFPLKEVQGISKGLEWPIEGLKFAPGVYAGTSNRVLGGPVRLEMSGPGMLIIVPRSALEAVVAALAENYSPARKSHTGEINIA